MANFFKKLRSFFKQGRIVTSADIENLEKKVDLLLSKNREYFYQLYYLPAIQKQHSKIWGEYKNKFKDKEVVLFATGPSAKHYKQIDGAIHVGVNRAIFVDDVKLDFYFLSDATALWDGFEEKYLNRFKNYPNKDLKKYCSLFYNPYFSQQDKHIEDMVLSETFVDKIGAERYYGIDTLDFFCYDITSQPLYSYGSVVFHALEFILYTNPKRIYIVGCDCSNDGYYDSSTQRVNLPVNSLINYWKFMGNRMSVYYSDTEIVSINPKGLKGLFKDVYTQQYANEFNLPENEIEILKG